MFSLCLRLLTFSFVVRAVRNLSRSHPQHLRIHPVHNTSAQGEARREAAEVPDAPGLRGEAAALRQWQLQHPRVGGGGDGGEGGDSLCDSTHCSHQHQEPHHQGKQTHNSTIN